MVAFFLFLESIMVDKKKEAPKKKENSSEEKRKKVNWLGRGTAHSVGNKIIDRQDYMKKVMGDL